MAAAGRQRFHFGKSKNFIKAARRKGKPGDAKADASSSSNQKTAEVLNSEESQRVIDRAMRHTTKDVTFDKEPVKREIYRALGALERATLTIDSVFGLLAEARGVVERSIEIEDQHDAEILAQQFDALLQMIDQTAAEATHDELNLVNGMFRNFEVALDLDGKARLMIGHANLTTKPEGLDLPFSPEVFSSNSDLELLHDKIDGAIERLKWIAQVYCSDARVLVDHYKDLSNETKRSAA